MVGNPEEIKRRLALDCAFTSLQGISGLHICAEYNSVNYARAHLDHGIDAVAEPISIKMVLGDRLHSSTRSTEIATIASR